jgi:peptidyl-prolyl cis-trans isomerase SurA
LPLISKEQDGLEPMASISRFLALAAIGCVLAFPAAAQSPFSPAIKINDRSVTWYEIDQRAEFLGFIHAPGDLGKLARKQLIEERLKAQAAAEAKVEVTPEAIAAGMEEFAARGQLSKDDLVKALAAAGIDEQTFRDFAGSGVLWRETLRQKFAGRIAVSEDEIDRAMDQPQAATSKVEIAFSEIILPANTPEAKANSEALLPQLQALTSFADFEAAARQYSASPSAPNGGKLTPVALSKMQGAVAELLLPLSPGQVSEPFEIPNAIALFQLRGISDALAPQPEVLSVDYAVYHIPGGDTPETRAEAARIQARADGCGDLYGLAKGQPPEMLDRQAVALAAVPRDIALLTAPLDAGESVVRAGPATLDVVMLCGRTNVLPEGVTRDDVRNALVAQRANALGDAFIAAMRARAIIKEE